LTRYFIKKKEPRLFFRPQGSLKNGSAAGVRFFLPAFSSKEKAEGLSKKPYPVYYFSNI